MDSNTRFAVLVVLIVAAVGFSHWRLSAQIDVLERTKQAAEAGTGAAAEETSARDEGARQGDHYKRVAEAAVSAEDPATRMASLRYLLMMSKSDEDVPEEMADWARSEIARLKAARSPGLLGKQLELDVSGDAPQVDALDDDPGVKRLDEPSDSDDEAEYRRWDDDEKSRGARPPDKGLVDPFSK